MKKWLYLAGALAAMGLLSRLPHPARDIAKLKPVRAVYLYREGESLCIETDTDDSGSGLTLTEAYSNMKEKADGELFLDTAEFLILDPDAAPGPELCELFRPTCKVIFSNAPPDLKTVSDYLSVHPPQTTLAHLRAESV